MFRRYHRCSQGCCRSNTLDNAESVHDVYYLALTLKRLLDNIQARRALTVAETEHLLYLHEYKSPFKLIEEMP